MTAAGSESAESRTGTLILDRQERIVFQNRRCDVWLGQPLEETRGQSVSSLLPQAHPLSRAIAQAIRTPKAGGSAVRVQFEDADGVEVDALVNVLLAPGSSEPKVGEASEAAGWVVSIERLEPIETLRSAAECASRMNAMSRLTRGVVHEVKNPLNAMGLHLEVIRRKLPAESLRLIEPSVDVLAREIRTLDRMVKSLVDFMRPPDLALRPVDPAAMLAAVRDLMTPDAHAHGVEIVLDRGEGDAPVPAVIADEAQLRQAVTHLAQNAIDAMPDGGILDLRCRALEGAESVQIQVVDHGTGISPDELERVAQLYYSTKEGSSGIGLSIVHRTVQLHGGSIEIDSAPGRGTSINVTLLAERRLP